MMRMGFLRWLLEKSMSKRTVIKIAKPGKSAESTNPTDFTLHSDYNMWKVSSTGSGTMTVPVDDTIQEVTVTHNLGYNPYFLLYVKDASTNKWHIAPVRYPGTFSGQRICVGYEYTNANTITIKAFRSFDSITNGDPSESVAYKFYVFIERADDPWTDTVIDPQTTDVPTEPVVRIARPGANAKNAVEEDLVFSSEFSTLKIAKILHFSIAGTQAHGLSYVPAFISMSKTGTYWGVNNSGQSRDFNGNIQEFVSRISVDATNVYCDADTYVVIFIDNLNG